MPRSTGAAKVRNEFWGLRQWRCGTRFGMTEASVTGSATWRARASTRNRWGIGAVEANQSMNRQALNSDAVFVSSGLAQSGMLGSSPHIADATLLAVADAAWLAAAKGEPMPALSVER
jgi:hypothetical protein